MDVNYYVLFGLISRILCVLMLSVFIIPRQVREIINNPKDEVTPIRFLLLAISLLFIVLSVIPFVYNTTRIESPNVFDLQNLASISSNMANLLIVTSFTTIYIVVDRINNSRKR